MRNSTSKKIAAIDTGFPGGSHSKETACNAGDPGSIPGSGRSPGEENGTHSSILAWESHGQRSLLGYSPWDLKHGKGMQLHW